MKHNYNVNKIWPTMLVLVATTALNAQNYAIRLSTPAEVGQNYAVTATGSKFEKTSIEDKPVKVIDYRVNFLGRAKVLEVDGKKIPIKIAFTVDSFTKNQGGATIDLLKPGTVVIADDTQEEQISLKDGALEERAREAFHLIYSSHTPDDVTDDEVFGTKERKSIGDRWSINPSLVLASASFKDSGLMVPPGHLIGMTSLLGIDKVADIDCLSVRGDIKADDISPKDLPQGVSLARGRLQGRFQGCYPIEDARLAYKDGMELRMELQIRMQGGGTVEIMTTQKVDSVWVLSDK